MSNRQERNRRKARRRRDRILSSFPDALGFRIYAEVFDYGRTLRVVAVRQADGGEFGVRMPVDRLWRHMEAMPQRLVDQWLVCFAPLTPKDC